MASEAQIYFTIALNLLALVALLIVFRKLRAVARELRTVRQILKGESSGEIDPFRPRLFKGRRKLKREGGSGWDFTESDPEED